MKKYVHIVDKCLCNKRATKSLYFKQLPITDVFLNRFYKSKKYYFDQKINFCKSCNHLFLGRQMNSKYIYNTKNYLFSSSKSFSAIHSNDTFIKFIDQNIKLKKIKQITEIGSNDLYLLKKFYTRSKKLIGVDPVIKIDKQFKKIKTIKKFFDKRTIKEYLDNNSDIIVCGHTLEHVENVDQFIKDTLSISNNKTKIFFQFPSAETLIKNNSFDQLHHQHLNLFSLKSFKLLLERNGAKIIDYKFNNLHYGALMVFFTLKKSKVQPKRKIDFKNNQNIDFIKSYFNFKNHLNSYEYVIDNYLKSKKNFYVIGASLMLPLINYHLNNIMNKADGILDDDKRKIGKFFPGINTKILPLKNTDIENSVCLIAPVASTLTCRKLVEILKNKKAETILLPTITF